MFYYVIYLFLGVAEDSFQIKICFFHKNGYYAIKKINLIKKYLIELRELTLNIVYSPSQ